MPNHREVNTLKKYLVAVGIFAVTLAGLSAEAQAQTYGGFYGGYGDNGLLNRALVLRRAKRKAQLSKRKAHSPKRVYQKKHARRSNRSYRSSRRG
jgi:hypothetical protein